MAKAKAKKKIVIDKAPVIQEPKQQTVDAVLDNLMNTVNKAYGKPVMSRASKLELEKIESGIFPIDLESEGGIPRGRGIIIVGPESAFKSTALYMIGGRFQRVCGNCLTGRVKEINHKKCNLPMDADNVNVGLNENGERISLKFFVDGNYNNVYCPGEKCTHKKALRLYEHDLECSVCDSPQYSIFVLIDAEHNYTKKWARKFGVIHHYLALTQTTHSQQIGDILRESLNTGRVSFLGVDSVDAQGPKEEEEASHEDWQMGLQARVWNKITRSIHGLFNKFFTYVYNDKEGNEVVIVKQPEPTVCLIQQYREKIGGYGDPRVIGGGAGKKYLSSLTIEITPGEKDWREKSADEKDLRGVFFNFGFIKAKTNKPYRYGRFFFSHDTSSVINSVSLIHYAVKYEIVKKGGAWYTYGEEKFQGIAKFTEFLVDSPKAQIDLRKQIIKAHNN